MTEDDVKTKWCPMYRAFNYQIEGNNAFGNNRGNSACKESDTLFSGCIASDCMAWREHEQGWDADSIHEGQGYCGLAGKP